MISLHFYEALWQFLFCYGTITRVVFNLRFVSVVIISYSTWSLIGIPYQLKPFIIICILGVKISLYSTSLYCYTHMHLMAGYSIGYNDYFSSWFNQRNDLLGEIKVQLVEHPTVTSTFILREIQHETEYDKSGALKYRYYSSWVGWNNMK